jgi:uncharacterized protein
MRVVLDTNILVSALLIPYGAPAGIYRAWREHSLELITCPAQLDELRATLSKPRLAVRFKPYQAGRLVNELKELAELIEVLPVVKRSPDPTDDFLLALCEAGRVDYLVTGDKCGLLELEKHGMTRIHSAQNFMKLLR